MLNGGAWLAMAVFTKIFAVTAYLPAILLAGFFETQFKEFEGSGFLLSPALV